MNIEEIADQIPSLQDTLDSLTQRMDTLKNTLPVRGQYFNQILEATEVVRCCTCCIILPDEDCSCDCSESTSPISCEGATNIMSFSSISGRWSIFIDDMETPAVSNTIGSAISQLSLDYSGRIIFDYDGFVYIQNQENISHRLKFVPESETSFIPNSADNPSFMPYEDGSFSFCLAPPSSLISCDGATSEIYFPNFSGIWNIEIDGELHLTAGLYVAPYLRENFAHIFEANDDGFMGISNKDSLPHRIKLIPIEDDAYSSPSNNPSFMEHEDGSISFCLIPQRFVISCTPSDAQYSVQLNKVRDTLPFLTFNNVAFNIYENGTQIAVEVSLLDTGVMENLGLLVTVIDTDGRIINISNMDSFNDRALELKPTMGIVDDVDTSLGYVLKQDGSFFMCLAKQPS